MSRVRGIVVFDACVGGLHGVAILMIAQKWGKTCSTALPPPPPPPPKCRLFESQTAGLGSSAVAFAVYKPQEVLEM